MYHGSSEAQYGTDLNVEITHGAFKSQSRVTRAANVFQMLKKMPPHIPDGYVFTAAVAKGPSTRKMPRGAALRPDAISLSREQDDKDGNCAASNMVCFRLTCSNGL